MIKRIWDVTFTVSDLGRAIWFYEEVLGLQKKYEFKDYAGFDCGGVEIGLKTWGGLEKPRKGEPCVNFLVEDVDEAYKTLRQRGVTFLKEPDDTPWGGRIALFTDPDGNLLQITQIDWKRYFAACAPR
ncbi:VOC family protein [Candidatus Bathyarchaeota archaeon]|nr:VOC family protein [Candidatus Bathyarchaeota archaeon]